MTATVSHLWLYHRPSHAMAATTEARAIADRGLEGCGHARPGGKRQVLLIDEETLAEFDLLPGRVKENVTTRGLAIQALPPGALVRLGEALLEISMPCEPCEFMDSIRPGLREATWGKRGVLARVKEGGLIRVGSEVRVERAAK